MTAVLSAELPDLYRRGDPHAAWCLLPQRPKERTAGT